MHTLLRAFIVILLAAAIPAVADTKADPPVPVRTVSPEYPEALLRDGVSGVVTVKCMVDEHGNVVTTEILKSTHSEFEKPAVDALMKWKFKPAKQDGVAVAMKIAIPIKFNKQG